MNEFDELTKAMAQSATRRAAFKKFGIGLCWNGAGLPWAGKQSRGSSSMRGPIPQLQERPSLLPWPCLQPRGLHPVLISAFR
jgi:hypothetical protein